MPVANSVFKNCCSCLLGFNVVSNMRSWLLVCLMRANTTTTCGSQLYILLSVVLNFFLFLFSYFKCFPTKWLIRVATQIQVPWKLTPKLKWWCIDGCQELLRHFEAERDGLLSQIVTGDETWAHYHLLEMKRRVQNGTIPLHWKQSFTRKHLQERLYWHTFEMHEALP